MHFVLQVSQTVIPCIHTVTIPQGADRPEHARAQTGVVAHVVTAVVRTVGPAIGNRGVGVLEHPTRQAVCKRDGQRIGITPHSRFYPGISKKFRRLRRIPAGAGPPPPNPHPFPAMCRWHMAAPHTDLSIADRPEHARAQTGVGTHAETAVARTVGPATGNRGVGVPEQPTRL